MVKVSNFEDDLESRSQLAMIFLYNSSRVGLQNINEDIQMICLMSWVKMHSFVPMQVPTVRVKFMAGGAQWRPVGPSGARWRPVGPSGGKVRPLEGVRSAIVTKK